MAVKAAAQVLADERLRKAAGWVVVAVLSPLILVVVLLCALLSGATNHNNAALTLCFSNAPIPGSLPPDYRQSIQRTRTQFADIDRAVTSLEELLEDGGSIDVTRIKAVLFTLWFGETPPATLPARLVDCFIRYEERTRLVDRVDEFGQPIQIEDTYTVAIPVDNPDTVYRNIETVLGRPVTPDNRINISEIRLRVAYDSIDIDAEMPLEGGNNTHALIAAMTDSEAPPQQGSWQHPLSIGSITSPFGYRPNPTESGYEGHTGLDLAAPRSTSIRAAQGGRVLFVRRKATGYGYHLVIDHGGGTATLYAHCSEIMVSEGQQVAVGESIAKVGSTGRSTGNHLHWEVVENGVPMNPQSYLHRKRMLGKDDEQ